jgi:hypothetical protein
MAGQSPQVFVSDSLYNFSFCERHTQTRQLMTQAHPRILLGTVLGIGFWEPGYRATPGESQDWVEYYNACHRAREGTTMRYLQM